MHVLEQIFWVGGCYFLCCWCPGSKRFAHPDSRARLIPAENKNSSEELQWQSKNSKSARKITCCCSRKSHRGVKTIDVRPILQWGADTRKKERKCHFPFPHSRWMTFCPEFFTHWGDDLFMPHPLICSSNMIYKVLIGPNCHGNATFSKDTHTQEKWRAMGSTTRICLLKK